MRARVAAVVVALAACGGASEQHEVTQAGDLLTEDGRLREPGWSPRQLQRWNPERVDDPERLRQWDFFMITNGSAAVNVTMSDLGFLQFGMAGVIDFAGGASFTGGATANDGDMLLTPAVEGDASLIPAGHAAPGLTFATTADTTVIMIDLPASILGEPAQGAFTIHRRPELPYLSLATPFAEDPHFFFFEQKIHGMTAEGWITIAGRTWTFDAADTSAVMDWGRGEWPSEVTWRWAGASGMAGGRRVAFNLGEGFGDDSAATENLLVVDDVPHKLGRVAWSFDPADPMADWSFDSADGRLSLVLHPIAPEFNDLDLGARFSHLRKAYGRYAGTVALDDGTEITIADLPGFAEEMNLSW